MKLQLYLSLNFWKVENSTVQQTLTLHMLIPVSLAQSWLDAVTGVTIWQHTEAELANGRTLSGVPTATV
jgi:hypothetical protein